MMAWTTSITMQNLVEIARRESVRGRNVMFFTFYRQDLPEGQLCLYFVYSRADFGVFRTDQGQIWQGGADHRYAPLCQI